MRSVTETAVVVMSHPLPDLGRQRSAVGSAPVVGPRPIDMHGLDSDALVGQNGQDTVAPVVFEPKRHTAVRTELLGARNQLYGEPVPLQDALRSHGVVRAEKADQAVHVSRTSRPSAAHEATSRMASSATCTSADVLNHPKLKRNVPAGNVPSVRCAAGAQCRPLL